MSAKIFILYTGGTIGMAPSNPSDPKSALEPKAWEQLAQYMPSIQSGGYFTKKGITCSYHSFKTPIDSSQITPEHWIQIAEEIEANYDDFDGFIIIHGTDTMAYTASVLSFIFQNLGKPVVLTGSQLPISHSRTDAINNFSNAIHIAAAGVFGLPVIAEVMICFHDRLLRGNRSSKASTNDFDGFESPNYHPLGRLGEHIYLNQNLIMAPASDQKPFGLTKKLNTNVLDISIFPGLKPCTLRRLLDDKEVEGVILRCFGAGNAPMNKKFLDVLSEASSKGTLILNISQCVKGKVNMHKYKVGKKLLEAGVIGGSDMTKEAALTKMMWVLANVKKAKRVQSLCTDLRGELSY
jgi:L-asparaginase